MPPCGRSGCSTSAGASRWARGRSPAWPTSKPARARAGARREPETAAPQVGGLVWRRQRGAPGLRRAAMSAEPSRTPSARWRLLRWTNRFAATNVALVMVVGLGYLWHYTPVGVVGWTYAAIAYLGHLAALSYVPLALVLVPAAMLIPWPRVLLPLGAVLAA